MTHSLLWEKRLVNKRYYFVEILVNGLLEISSILDFFFDVLILIQLGKSTDTAWFTFTLFTMVCPYYTVYTSLMTYQIRKLNTNKSGTNLSMIIKKIFLILPTSLLVMLMVDILLMIFNTILSIISLILLVFPQGNEIY